jgi:hypothetical protein
MVSGTIRLLRRGRRWVALGLGLLAGCTPPPLEHVVLTQGFEHPLPPGNPVVAGILPVIPSPEQAHTGQFAAKVDQSRTSAMLCGTTWQALGRPHHLRLRFWLWQSSLGLNAASVTLLVQRPDQAGGMPGLVHARQLGLNEAVRQRRQWKPSTLFVSLPHDLQPTDEVALTLWGSFIGAKDAVFIDDVIFENADKNFSPPAGSGQ